MTDNLLVAPERAAIEEFLQRNDSQQEEKASYERVLGYLSCVVITPGHFMPSDWLEPLFDLNDIIFDSLDDANRFMSALMPLYNRVNAVRLREENLFPFDLSDAVESENARRLIIDWAIGLHHALTLRPKIWGAEEKEASHVPADLLEEVQLTIPFLWGLAKPQAIPEIMPDPVPFQRNVLSKTPGWTQDMLSETWNDELINMFRMLCIGQLRETTEILQRYSKAYARKPVATVTPLRPLSGKKKIGRNDPCPCGSGKKYKKCCGD